MIIDAHGHLVPPDLLATIRKERTRFPSLRLVEDGSGAAGPGLALAFAGGKPSRPIMPGLSDVQARRAWMRKAGIDRQVVGGWPDWFGYELPAAEGEAWCQLFNAAQLAAAKAVRAASERADAGRHARRRRVAIGDRGGVSRRNDLDIAARDRQRPRHAGPGPVLESGG